MDLLRLLLQSAGQRAAIAVATGLVSGLGSAWLISLLNRAVTSPIGLALPFVGVAIAVLLTGLVCQKVLIELSQEAVYRLRLQLSERILQAPLSDLEELGANRLLATLTDDVVSLSTSVYFFPFLCIDLAVIFGCFAYLATLSTIVFLATLVVIGLAVTAVQWMMRRAGQFLKQARQEQDQLFKHLQALITGIKELKLNRDRRHYFLNAELRQSAAASRDYTNQALVTFAIASSVGQFIFFVIVGLLVFALPHLVQVPTAVLSGYVLTMTYLMLPFKTIIEKLPVLLKANVSLKKIDEMGLRLAQDSEQLTGSGSDVKAVPSWKSLTLTDVEHHYPGSSEPFALGPINLVFKPHEITFIVGGNGSGKSTLAKILVGLYAPNSGQILLDGIAVTDGNRDDYRQQFSGVFADFHLFDQLLGSLGSDRQHLDQTAQQYLEDLQIAHKVSIDSGRLSTTALSQGQRKRLALLNAYLEDRSIYFFDEWAADQDPYFREIFYQQILPGLKQRGKCVIAVSHDDRYFGLADRVIKLDYGKVESETRPAPNCRTAPEPS
jgi:putative pyoverdin transport system ATP-binding/permease protein